MIWVHGRSGIFLIFLSDSVRVVLEQVLVFLALGCLVNFLLLFLCFFGAFFVVSVAGSNPRS